jgi:hypothetical protein
VPVITVTAWPDPVIDTLGHDPRSEYVERFWLPTLGPTTLLLLRRLANRFDRSHETLELDGPDLSQSLGVGARDGASTPLMRSFDRLAMFDLASTLGERAYAVRRTLPPVNRRHHHRPPMPRQREHDEWVADQLTSSALEHARRRARRLAFALFEQGDDLDHVERVLLGVGFHPTVCRESAQWAYDRHRAAFEALGASADEPPTVPAVDPPADSAA